MVDDRLAKETPRASTLQESLWLAEQLADGDSPYHLPLSIDLTGSIDGHALASALQDVVHRHEVLASIVTQRDGDVFLLAGTRRPELEVVDLRPLAGPARSVRLEESTRAETTRPFHLEHGPLLRATLYRLTSRHARILVVAHHLVFDGASKDVLVRDLLTAYDARLRHDAPDLPPLPQSYAAYARDERTRVEQTRGHAAEFWRHAWHPPEETALPDARRRPARPWATAGGAHDIALDVAFCRRLDAVASTLGATRFHVLLAALHCLLVRYGNWGTAVATDFGTRTAATRDAVGLFVNELPVAADLSGDLSFAEAVARVRDSVLAVSAVRHVPLGTVLGGAARRGRPPVSVSYRRRWGGDGRIAASGYTASVAWSLFVPTVRTELHLQLVDSGPRIAASVRYARDVLPDEAAARVAAHLRELTASAVAAPHTRIGDLALAPSHERRQIVAGWNRTAIARPQGRTLDVLLREQLTRTPDACAVVAPPERLSYGELARRAALLAADLRARGIGPESRVGLCMQRSVELVVALLGVLQAGAAFLPLDPDLPDERLRLLLTDATPDLVLTQSALDSRLARLGARTSPLAAAVQGTRPTRPVPAAVSGRVHAENAAYVLYTSGTTGTPKGVVISHVAICNRLEWMQRRYQLRDDDAVLHKTPIGFDVSVWELLWPLICGARLVLARPAGHRDPRYLRQVITEESVTTLHFVPSMLAVFLDSHDDPASCRSLRRTLCSGEELPVPVARRFLDVLPGELHNLYGPTEAAIDVSAHTVTSEATDGAERVPIGRPIDNIQLYVLDQQLTPVPIGIPGELHIGGVGVARGYLGRAALTAERFVPDPVGPPGGRLYQTGDRARWRPDGTLEYLGRLDDQVKIAGVRVELGEVEAALREQPGIAEAAAAVRHDPAGNTRLVGYVVAAPGSQVDLRELRHGLARLLPAQAVPTALVPLAALPIGVNGKLDRAALPEPPTDRAPRQTAAGDTKAEQLVARLWTQVLGTPPASVDESFFDGGGTSLSAARLAGLLSAEPGSEITLRAVFDHPTVRELARHLDALLPGANARGEDAGPGDARSDGDGDGDLPTTYFQEEQWLREHRGVPTHAGISMTYRLHGDLDVPALEHGLAVLVERHEPLRSTYHRRGADLVQRVQPGGAAALSLVDLAPLPPNARSRALELLLADADDEPWNLEQGPVLRTRLVRLDRADHVLFLSVHHIAADDWSMRVLADELGAVYGALTRGEPLPLAPLPSRYRDYVRWHRRRVQERRDSNVAFWARQLADLPPLLRLPGGPDPKQVHRYRRLRHILSVPEGVEQALGADSGSIGATPFVGYLGAYAVCLADVTGHDDVVIASLFSGRDRPETERLVGLVAELTVFRASLAGDPTFLDVLGRVRAGLLDAYEHKDLPLRAFARELGLGAPSDLRLPIWNVWINATDSRRNELGIVHELDLPGLRVTPHVSRTRLARHKHPEIWEGDNLSLVVAGDATCRQLVLDYNAEFFAPEQADAFSTQLMTTVERLAASPTTRVTAARRHQGVGSAAADGPLSRAAGAAP